jgi:hypothetical protein
MIDQPSSIFLYTVLNINRLINCTVCSINSFSLTVRFKKPIQLQGPLLKYARKMLEIMDISPYFLHNSHDVYNEVAPHTVTFQVLTTQAAPY